MTEKRKIKQAQRGPDGSIAEVTLNTGEKLPIEETIRQIKLGTVSSDKVDTQGNREVYEHYKQKAHEMDLIDVDVDNKEGK